MSGDWDRYYGYSVRRSYEDDFDHDWEVSAQKPNNHQPNLFAAQQRKEEFKLKMAQDRLSCELKEMKRKMCEKTEPYYQLGGDATSDQERHCDQQRLQGLYEDDLSSFSERRSDTVWRRAGNLGGRKWHQHTDSDRGRTERLSEYSSQGHETKSSQDRSTDRSSEHESSSSQCDDQQTDEQQSDDQKTDDQQTDNQQSDDLQSLTNSRLSDELNHMLEADLLGSEEGSSQGKQRTHSGGSSPSPSQKGGTLSDVQEFDSTGSGGTFKKDVPHNPASERVEEHIRDLKQKLMQANIKFEDSEKASALEEKRALAVEAELRDARKNYGGTDLEHQLMEDLCRARARCKDLEDSGKHDSAKFKGIEVQLSRDNERRQNIQYKFEAVKKEKEDLVKEIAALKKGKVKLESQDARDKTELSMQEKNVRLMAAERDETLDLLDKAMKQKELTKYGRQRDVDAKLHQVKVLEDERAKEQFSIRQFARSVDGLVFDLQKNKSYDRYEAFHELIRVRDGMHTLIAKRKILDASAQLEAEGLA